MEKANCRSCNAAIRWLRSAATGAIMPVDFDPAPDGNIAIIDGAAHVIKGEEWEKMLPEIPRYKSHFATCPQAAQHRKGKTK